MIDDDDKVMELINPEILLQEGEQTGPEGCLSVPGKFGMVTRPNHVRVRAQDRYGNWFEAEARAWWPGASATRSSTWTATCSTEHIDRFLTDEELEAYYREQGYEMPDGEDEAE